MAKEDSALIFKIRSLIPELSKSEALVAEYISGNPDEVIKLSVSALADCCGVSEPTVIRACRNIGFSGYQALKIALIQSRNAPVQCAGEEVSAEDSMQSAIGKVFAAALDAVTLTRDNLNLSDMEKAAGAKLLRRFFALKGLDVAA